MKPTQEQVIAWANEVKLCGWKWVDDDDDRDVESLCDFAAFAYGAGHKDENEACAEVCEEIARLYSTDIFPEDGTSIDCNSAKMGRVVTRNCAQSIRARREHG